jgi:hypothetical protein
MYYCNFFILGILCATFFWIKNLNYLLILDNHLQTIESSMSNSIKNFNYELNKLNNITVLPTYNYHSNDLLILHNNKRQSVGLSTLQWSEDLALFAHNYVPQLCNKFQHSSFESRSQIGPFKRVGENIILSYVGMSSSDLFNLWFNEIYCYKYGTLGAPCTNKFDNICQEKSGAGYQNGHVTELLWSTLTHLGCAIYICEDHTTLTVSCNYAAFNSYGGNMLGVLPFNSEVAKKLNLNSAPCDQNSHDEL